MKNQIEQLNEIANKDSRTIIGLMSGTSLDGLDVVCCQVEGSGSKTKLRVLHFSTIPYDQEFKEEIRKVFAKRQIDLQDLCLLNPYIGLKHGQMVNECLALWGLTAGDIDLIASHGQTVYHAPKKQHQIEGFPNASLQIGDGDHIAVTTGIITLSDFRQKHMAVGGEGAPLAVYGDYFLFSEKGQNRILLNMGGIANFTILPGNLDAQAVFTTDTGPGNTLLDAYMRRLFRLPYDENGAAAAKGSVNEKLLENMKKAPFFGKPFPKTTGPEVFNYDFVETAIQQARLTTLSRNDIIATLTQFSADTIVEAIKIAINPNEPYTLYASGGGAHNPVLMEAIQAQLPQCPLMNLEVLGVTGDAKEAALFAVLANEAVAGNASDFGSRDGVPQVTMGKISLPG
ncbi:anhydro-N-acetylmuramic acid kinase [Dyadobacter jejuensis]|uniref:Anhydro-N-acetylmuramic acid kinase n=1 Tax=Dyadobacter jejuensis TaxID=1082580 RepID=A0A316AH59_9BACT|nr:anhydro-N-acetylmuramic acid kinase [Dyadobacter jejuensis]PWJ56971.1 anhydro-N-acetylmuramic acid kinase [Dyadobacter jejuensis]